MFPRKQYIDKMITKKGNGRVKIITGIRRCGKTTLLFQLYKNYLLETGIGESSIITLALDTLENAKYRNPIELDKFIRNRITDSRCKYYVFIDEIQFVLDIQNPYVDDPDARINFVDVVLGLMQLDNLDIYVTGSNSRMLSSDILSQFRDRGDEIRIFPLSFAEFSDAYKGDMRGAWQDYSTYGGMPLAINLEPEEKCRYLKLLLERTYLKDLLERHDIKNKTDILSILLSLLGSNVGLLTNPNKLAIAFKNKWQISVASDTLEKYIGYFEEAYLVRKVMRYDIKWRKYVGASAKYYFIDPGLRNALFDFRQVDETYMRENILYHDLIRREMDVAMGFVEYNTKDAEGKKIRQQLEVNFVVNKGNKRFYIQSVSDIADPEKREQVISPLKKIPDSFPKIVVVRDYLNP